MNSSTPASSSKLITIIILPFYDGSCESAILKRTIENLNQEKYQSLRIVSLEDVLPNSSTDILKWEGYLYDSLRKAISSIDGEIFGWLYAGDTYEAGWSAGVINIFQSNPKIALLYGEGRLLRDDLTGFNSFIPVRNEYSEIADYCFRCIFPVFIRKSFFSYSPLWEEIKYHSRSYPYWLEISSKIPIAFLPSLRLKPILETVVEKFHKEKKFNTLFKRLKTFYGHIPLSWIPGMHHYRFRGKQHLYFLTRFGLFLGPEQIRRKNYFSFLNLVMNRSVRQLFGFYLHLRRLPWVIYRKFLRPGIGRLGEGYGKPLFMLAPKNMEKYSLPSYPRISIVTPCYNQVEFIEKTVKSVLNQKYPELEYIIIDGGSTDGSSAVVQKYQQQLAYFHSGKDGGQTNAINIGFAKSTGEIMAYLNSDDLLLPGSLHYVAHYLTHHPEVDAVYGQRILIDQEENEIGRWILPPHDDEITKVVDFIPQETFFWRRRVWDETGSKLNESFHYAMDWEFIVRILLKGFKIVRVPVFLGAFRVHPKQKTTAAIQVGEEECRRIRMTTMGYIPTDRQIHKIILPYLLKARIWEWLHKLNPGRFNI